MACGDIVIKNERRRVYVKRLTDKPGEYGFLHMFYVDADNEPAALVEGDDGGMFSVWANYITFVEQAQAYKLVAQRIANGGNGDD